MPRAQTVAIVGGGAAGLMAAVVAAERGCAVSVYEATDRVGRPILASGNGRCNFSNSLLDPSVYHNAEFARDVLCALDAAAPSQKAITGEDNPFTRPVHEFFARHGLVWAEEGEGRLYPASRKATSVLDVLRFSARAAGVELCCSTPLSAIEPPRAPEKPFTLRTREGEFKRADAAIVAVGGTIAQSLLPGAVPFSPLRPVLGPLATNTDIVRSLDNTRARVTITLHDSNGNEKARENGEVLFRKYGVSGIAVFNLSRFAQPGDELRIDLLPQVAGENRLKVVEAFLRRRFDGLSCVYRTLSTEEFFRGLFVGVLAEAVCKQAGVGYEQPLERAALSALARAISSFSLTVVGIGDEKQCQMHRGGLCVSALDASTMQLIDCPGLFVVGEALDVDGPCGGYNLHWAWSTGMLAALSC